MANNISKRSLELDELLRADELWRYPTAPVNNPPSTRTARIETTQLEGLRALTQPDQLTLSFRT